MSHTPNYRGPDDSEWDDLLDLLCRIRRHVLRRLGLYIEPTDQDVTE